MGEPVKTWLISTALGDASFDYPGSCFGQCFGSCVVCDSNSYLLDVIPVILNKTFKQKSYCVKFGIILKVNKTT